MLERFRLEVRLRKIVYALGKSQLTPVRRNIVDMLKPFLDEYAKAMVQHRYDSYQAVIRIVTALAVYGEREGNNKQLRQKSPELYQDFHNLYRFCQLAYFSYPSKVENAFCVPVNEGDPEPFTVSAK